MLHDLPKSQGAALVAHPADAMTEVGRSPVKARRRTWLGREKVVKPSALGMLLKPIGISVAFVLSAYALLSLGTTFYRSYYRHLDTTAAVHPDKSVLDIF